jgi:hypothetical protein
VVAGVFLASFVAGRAGSLIAHHGFAGPAAWAQGWDEPSDGADSPDATPPDIAGSYSGSATDHRFGDGTISAIISQHGSKVSGSWETDLNGGSHGSLKGTVKANGAVKIRLKIRGSCGLNVSATFENGDEIAGTYKVTGCGKPDHGMFDMID